MKDKAPLWLIGSMLFLGVIGGFVNTPKAHAGDDPVVNLSMSADAGAETVCTSSKMKLTRHAVQPTVAAYVWANPTNDGGLSVTYSNTVKVAADGLYDIWPTSDMPYICCKPAANGAASNCKILKYREF